MDVRTVNKEFTSPPNVAYGVIGNGDANHNPPNMGTALNGPKSERHDDHARGISLNFVQGNLVPAPEQNITSVREDAGQCRVPRHP